MLVEKKVHIENNEIGYVDAIYNSQNILKSTYFPKSEKLYIVFNKGNIYSYLNITQEIYDDFENAESQGKYFHSNIRNNEKYPTYKEYKLYPNEIDEIKKIISEWKKNNQILDDE